VREGQRIAVLDDSSSKHPLALALFLSGAAGGLIAIDVQNVLNNNNVDVTVPVTVRDVNVAVNS